MKLNCENLYRKSPKPLWFRTFLRRYLNRFALLVAEAELEPRPVAVPYIFGGGQSRLENIDRCHSLASFLPPPAAVGSLPSGL